MLRVGHEILQHVHLRIVILEVDLILSDITSEDLVAECAFRELFQKGQLKYSIVNLQRFPPCLFTPEAS